MTFHGWRQAPRPSPEQGTSSGGPPSNALVLGRAGRPDLSDASSRWRTAKASLTTVLDFALIAIDGFPIPGVKAVLSAVVLTISKIDVCYPSAFRSRFYSAHDRQFLRQTMKSNAKTLGLLQTHVETLCAYVVVPLKQMEEEDIPYDLKESVQRLVK